MKPETIRVIREKMNSGMVWDMGDVMAALVVHEGMPNTMETRLYAAKIENLLIRFDNFKAMPYYHKFQYHRWQSLNELIMTKVYKNFPNGDFPVTQAEKVHCYSALMNSEV